MGPQGKNLVNKAYRSTRSESTAASSNPEPLEEVEFGGLAAAELLGQEFV